MKKRSIPFIIAALSLGAAFGQAPPQPPVNPPAADPFQRVPSAAEVAPDGNPAAETPKQVSLLFEAFSLDPSEAAKMLRKGIDGKDLYRQVTEKVTKKEATQEGLIVLKARSGEKALVMGISEQIYATEFIPPYIPPRSAPTPTPQPATPGNPSRVDVMEASRSAVEQGRRTSGPVPVTATSFETRNAGWSFEIEPTIGANNKVIDLRFVPNLTRKVGTTSYGQGISRTEMPIYDAQRIETALTINAGVPFLIGTMSRSPVSPASPETSKRVWFAFITATIVNADGTVLKQ